MFGEGTDDITKATLNLPRESEGQSLNEVFQELKVLEVKVPT